MSVDHLFLFADIVSLWRQRKELSNASLIIPADLSAIVTSLVKMKVLMCK